MLNDIIQFVIVERLVINKSLLGLYLLFLFGNLVWYCNLKKYVPETTHELKLSTSFVRRFENVNPSF